jgi:hypothetical protein
VLSTVNAELRQIHGFADFLASCARDTAHAEENGLRIGDKFANPDCRDSVVAVATYPLHVWTEEQIESLRTAAVAVAVKAGRIAQIRAMSSGDRVAQCNAVLGAMGRVMRDRIATLQEFFPEHWAVFSSQGKQHLAGDVQVNADVEQFHQTGSCKGDATTIRYNVREIGDNAKSGHGYASYSPVSIDERGMAGE